MLLLNKNMGPGRLSYFFPRFLPKKALRTAGLLDFKSEGIKTSVLIVNEMSFTEPFSLTARRQARS